MSRSTIRLLGLGVIAAALAASAPALAEPGRGGPPPHAQQDKHVGKQNGKHAEREHGRDSRRESGRDRHGSGDRGYWESRPVAWDHSHRDVIVRYYDSHRVSCPPGLIETRSGCLPRGQAKKRYVIGRPLPSTVVVETLPYDLHHRLPPPPHGYIYRRVDGDVLLIAEATKKVIDAVVLFSAL